MRVPLHASALVLALLPTLDTVNAASRKPEKAVLLADIQSLTFRAGKNTAARRVDAIPQLTCIGGSAQGFYEVDVMRCQNSGPSYDEHDVEWTCTASLPAEFKLGSTDVICEGYASPDDPYVLKGSCGVEYRLVLTEAGETKYNRNKAGSTRPQHHQSKDGYEDQADANTNALVTSLFFMVFIGVAGFIVWGMIKAYLAQRGQRNEGGANYGGHGGGGGGGGGPGSFDDPPPPYDPSPDEKPRYYTGTSAVPPPTSASSSSQGNQFWRGAATGAAAGAAAAYVQPSLTSWLRGGGSREAAQGPGPATRARRAEAEWSEPQRRAPSPPRAPSSSSSFSATRHESTGFGGSRRR